MMKMVTILIKNCSILVTTLGLLATLCIPSQSIAFAESASSSIQPSSIQVGPITIPEPPQPGDPVSDLDYYVISGFTAESTPHSTISFNAEGITDVQFTAFPFPGQNKEIVVFSLETETETETAKGWESVFVATFQPSSKVQKQHMKLPRNDYKKFRIFISSTNPNLAVLGYKQWSN